MNKIKIKGRVPLHAENIEFGVPTTRRQHTFLIQRPRAPYNEFCMRIVNPDQVAFSRGWVCCPSGGSVSAFCLKLYGKTNFTSDKSYHKTHLRASRAYEDSIAPCVWHIHVQQCGSHIVRRPHSPMIRQAATCDNPIS